MSSEYVEAMHKEDEHQYIRDSVRKGISFEEIAKKLDVPPENIEEWYEEDKKHLGTNYRECKCGHDKFVRDTRELVRIQEDEDGLTDETISSVFNPCYRYFCAKCKTLQKDISEIWEDLK